MIFLQFIIQFRRGAFFGALFDKLPLDGKLQDAVFQFLRRHFSVAPNFAVISARTRSISVFREARSSW